MAISSQEQEILFKNKIIEGKSSDIAKKEIERDITSQNQFKLLNKQLIQKDKLIKNLMSQIDALKKSRLKTNQKIFVDRLKNIDNTNSEQATIKDLNRILSILNDGKTSLSDLEHTCIIKKDKMYSALRFLEQNKIIRKYKQGRSIIISFQSIKEEGAEIGKIGNSLPLYS